MNKEFWTYDKQEKSNEIHWYQKITNWIKNIVNKSESTEVDNPITTSEMSDIQRASQEYYKKHPFTNYERYIKPRTIFKSEMDALKNSKEGDVVLISNDDKIYQKVILNGKLREMWVKCLKDAFDHSNNFRSAGVYPDSIINEINSNEQL